MPNLLIALIIAMAATGAHAQSFFPKTTYFYDSYGNMAGSASTNPTTSPTIFNNQYGGNVGSVRKGGLGQTVYYDGEGNYLGSANGPMFNE